MYFTSTIIIQKLIKSLAHHVEEGASYQHFNSPGKIITRTND